MFGKEGLTTENAPPAEAQVTDTARQSKKLWKYRPFTRVVRGYKPYVTLKNYVQLNEQEALGKIPYMKDRLKGRLKGLRPEEWDDLWN